MIRSFFGRCALFICTLALLAPAVPVQAMDAPAGEPEAGSSLLSKLTVAIALPAAGYAWLYRKHYNQLHALERELDVSTISVSAREHNFRFATWRSTEDNTPDGKPWADAHTICAAGDEVANKLMHDAKKCSDRVYVYDVLGTRCDSAKVTKQSINQAIAREKELLEDQLSVVAQYTDIPDMIVQQLAPDDTRCLTAHELAVTCASKLRINCAAELQNVITHYETPSKLKSVVHCGGWLPTSWSFAPCYQKASRVYMKLFLAYARLCALDAVVNVDKEVFKF